MRHTLQTVAGALILSLAVPSLAAAHVGVRPRESKPGVEEAYTVRVPTEGAVATSSVRVEIPEGVTILDIAPVQGGTVETEKRGDRVIAITWTQTIAPKAAAEFGFHARNPASGAELVWKAHQHFADGTVTDWVGPAGTNRPAPVTSLAQAVAGPGGPATDAAAVEAWLMGYDAAFNARDLDRLATFYDPAVTIYEGGGINNGWADYRDHHLGPELKAFEDLQFAHRDITVSLLGDGQGAYATARYSLKARMGDRAIDSEGLATYVLVTGPDGTWRIRHAHTSSRPARRPAQ